MDYTTPNYDRGSLGLEHGTCPACLRAFALRRGKVPRHGWHETGRKAGEYGRGWQSGACRGSNARPLEETDAMARAEIDLLLRYADDRCGIASRCDAGEAPVQTASVRARDFDACEPLKASAFVREVGRMMNPRGFGELVVLEVLPGFVGISHPCKLDSYATIAAREAEAMRAEAQSIRGVASSIARAAREMGAAKK